MQQKESKSLLPYIGQEMRGLQKAANIGAKFS
jgi:hypothetical protein